MNIPDIVTMTFQDTHGHSHCQRDAKKRLTLGHVVRRTFRDTWKSHSNSFHHSYSQSESKTLQLRMEAKSALEITKSTRTGNMSYCIRYVLKYVRRMLYPGVPVAGSFFHRLNHHQSCQQCWNGCTHINRISSHVAFANHSFDSKTEHIDWEAFFAHLVKQGQVLRPLAIYFAC